MKTISATIILILFALSQAASAIACCSVAPAEFKHTVGWVGEFHQSGKTFHVLVYANAATNLATRSTGGNQQAVQSGNAMLLPIPAVPHSLSPDNMIDGSQYKALIPRIYKETSDFITRSFDDMVSQTNALNGLGHSSEPMVFTKGSYTVVMSPSAAAIPSVLDRVPPSKRPPVNPELLAAYDKWYPGWTFALCCFDSSMGDVEPLVWKYEPLNPDQLFFPAVDEHSGNTPSMHSLVDVDHRLVVTTDAMSALGSRMPEIYSTSLPSLPELARDHNEEPVNGASRSFAGKRIQGDFVFRIPDVRAGIMRPLRIAPPGASVPFVFAIADMIVADAVWLGLLVGACLFLGGIILLTRKAWLAGGGMLVAIPLLVLSRNFVSDSTSPEALLTEAVVIALAVVAAMVLPFVVSAKRHTLSRLMIAGVLFCTFSAFFFTNYSKLWVPAVWLILLVRATTPASAKTHPSPPESRLT